MERKIRRCCVCMKEYEYCNKCKEDMNKPLWYFTFCSENCHNIYDITSKFEDKQIDVAEAEKQLEKLDLSNLDSFGNSYKNSISKITSFSSSSTGKNAESTETMENMVIVNDTEDTSVDSQLIEENSIEEGKGIVKKSKKRTKDIE